MSIIKRRLLQDKTYLAGLVFIAISLGIFCVPFFMTNAQQNDFNLFLLNFALTTLYAGLRLSVRKSVAAEQKIHHLFLLLILSLVSAYSLNREVTVFEDSVNWFSVTLVVCCVNYIAFVFFDRFPNWARHTVSFINGASLVVFAYLSFYLMPLYLISLPALILLGISIHSFVPALFLYHSLRLQSQSTSSSPGTYWYSFGVGSVAVLSFAVVYIVQWNILQHKINRSVSEADVYRKGLPAWVSVSQNIPHTTMAKKLLKADVVYSIPSDGDIGEFFWSPPRMNIGERRRHDPLVMLASLFSPKSLLGNNDRLKVLESMYQWRHEAAERLWRGDHLITPHVNTDVKLWPQCNVAYTEKKISVSNTGINRGWANEEEALYTFFMPEGSVVTSLSLWIDGREEKGLLATKAQAATAYETIVGHERRDPSVVHWQEGNTVTVRVFPVIAGQERVFKIGITSPLQRVNGKLQYSNIYFKGPDASSAQEDIHVDFSQPANGYELPGSFVSMTQQSYQYHGHYKPGWSISIVDPGIRPCSFSFDGFNYTLAPYHRKLAPAIFDNIYLDINSAWSLDEYNQVLGMTAGKNVYAEGIPMVKITAQNKQQVWDQLGERSFSLFPLYQIGDPEKSLLISKSHGSSPNMTDLDSSLFLTNTRHYLGGHTRIKLFNLGEEASPFLKSLREMRVFQYDNGDLSMLQGILQKGHFADDEETDNSIIIHESEMVINKEPGDGSPDGPDHLARLFAYNHIMQKLGKDLLLDRPVSDSLVQEAAKAYVVSPVSSLLVLERQQDYDRFNIKDTNNSLKNASLKSKGAVPEPGEWAIIILVVALLLFILKRNKTRARFQ